MTTQKENRDQRKQFLLDKTTASKLKEVAAQKNVSENELVLRAVNAYLKRFSFPSESATVTPEGVNYE